MGGDTKTNTPFRPFVVIVSIAGGDSWVGIPHPTERNSRRPRVSIAGGDSWVGILLRIGQKMLQGLVSIAGGDSWVGIRNL